MTKFIRALKGNIAAGGQYFPAGVSTPVDDKVTQNLEVQAMVRKDLLLVFNTLEAANNYRAVSKKSTR